MRRCLLLLFVVLLFVSNDAEAAKQKRAAKSGGGGTHVYLLRGIFNVSVGLDALAVKLTRRGIPASVYGHGEAGIIAAKAIADYRAGRGRSIVLVGHSLGAGGAVMVADALNEAGVPVSLLISLDPVSRHAVPGNVRRTVNFYSSSSGREIAAAPGARGTLRNVDMTGVAGIDHMSIQSLEMMHQRILAVIAGR